MSSIKHFILDTLMVLASTVATLSFVGIITLEFQLLPANINWLIFVSICYILRFGFSVPSINIIYKDSLLRLFLILILWEGLQGLIQLHSCGFMYLVEFLTYLVFYLYFYKATNRFTDIDRITLPYCLYYLFSCVIIILSAFLLATGVLSPTDNPITENHLMSDNLENGIYYYWPGHLSVIDYTNRIELFENVPVLTGYSHEPHVLCLSIIPAFFLLIYYIRDRKLLNYLLYLSLVIILLLSYSTTSVLCVSSVFFIELFYYNIKKGQVGKVLIVAIMLLIIAFTVASTTDIIEQILSESGEKLTEKGASKDYSASLLSYMFLPSNIIGDGLYPRDLSPKGFAEGNVGLVSAILIISIYIVFYRKILKCYCSNNTTSHYIGLSLLYFSFHSLKMGCLIFNYPLFFYMILLLDYARKYQSNT